MMECNKDEALRAKGTAEEKLLANDFAGAKRFALMAERMYPKLEGLRPFLMVVSVYVNNETKINGNQSDYYRILGVDPLADEQALKNQYKRMARALHPDKNKSVGANGAFQIVSTAWSVLSDKDQRNAYDYLYVNNSRASNHSSGVPTRPHTSTPPVTVTTRPHTSTPPVTVTTPPVKVTVVTSTHTSIPPVTVTVVTRPHTSTPPVTVTIVTSKVRPKSSVPTRPHTSSTPITATTTRVRPKSSVVPTTASHDGASRAATATGKFLSSILSISFWFCNKICSTCHK